MGSASGRGDRHRASRASVAAKGDVLDRLQLLEHTIQTGPPVFSDVGHALAEINEQRLHFAVGYSTFAAYIDRQLGISRAYAYRKISAARVVDILRKAGVDRVPSNEAQARELARLAGDSDAMCRAWLAAIEHSPTTSVTAAAIRAAVAARLPAPIGDTESSR